MTDWITRQTRLFRGGEQVENFRQMSTIYPVRVVRRAPAPSPLPRGAAVALPGGKKSPAMNGESVA